ncbi:SDR family NAD(P)-dependent oxidoreductase [Sphingomonas mali]|uniref:SDR family NAD(P)-dependent oxidoreductase n=1 Tax=Sphingomonas mali TaxID=40682 RepID=UPI0008333BBE|nr:SDR family oxidoreductase [Sphingomonas mali]
MLSQKTAFITGASRGLGRAAALSLARAGARIIAHFGSNEDAANSLSDEIRAIGGDVELIRGDLVGPESVNGVIAALGARAAEIDIVVASAGAARLKPFGELTLEDFDMMFALNVRTPYFLVQQLAPHLKQGSSVILLSSVVARAASVATSAYAATKGAVDVLARNFALELGPRGIRVNAIAPGAIETDMATFLKTEAGRERMLAQQALKRLGQPEDVADVILFLATDQSRWITGQTIEVSGGARL